MKPLVIGQQFDRGVNEIGQEPGLVRIVDFAHEGRVAFACLELGRRYHAEARTQSG